MTSVRLAVVAVLGAHLASCSDVSDRVAASAEGTRSATERLEVAAKLAEAKKEAKIAHDAVPVHQAEAVMLGERYYMRAEGQGWTIVDRETGKAGTRGGVPMTDMDLETARQTIDELRADTARR